ncbi:hypothetical protein JCM8097_003973 [Rhodosporidiobolus ruineniae]
MAQHEQRQPHHTLIALAITVCLFSFVAVCVLAPSLLRPFRRRLTRPIYALLARIPLPSGLQTPSDLAVAVRSFQGYADAQQRVLDRKYLAFERMNRRHRTLGDQIGWRDTLARGEDQVHEVNAVVTDRLAQLGTELARREGIPLGLRSRLWREDGRVVETLKHFVRDWSAEGKGERDALFPPILDGLRDEYGEAEGKKVLVPGCGLGRLAYEVASLGFSTDANDFSHFMNLGSSLIFTRTSRPNQHTLSPYLHNFSHQRSADNLLRTVAFPDVVPSKDVPLEFVAGDFLELFKEEGKYDAVVSLFFIDTASNLLNYFDTIFRALRPGAIWINEGPLLYYGNPGMELPLEDVLRLVQLVGFTIEERRSLKSIRYTADDLGMYSFTYDCEFWVARKPLDAAAGGERGGAKAKTT